jgi:signal transduction histidine kinase
MLPAFRSIVLKPGIHASILPTLGVGFALAILFLLASGYVSLQILESGETRGAALAEQQRFSTTLIDEIQGEEAGLSSLFYLIAASDKSLDRKPLLDRLALMEKDIGRILAAGRNSATAERWSTVSTAVSRFIEELRRSIDQPGGVSASDELYRRHEALVNALSLLVGSNYEYNVEAQRQEYNRSRGHLRRALLLLVIALVLSIACAIWTVQVAKEVFERSEWQARELSRLSGHVLETQETTVRNFSRELHDDLGQTLSAIEANLVATPPASPEQAGRLEDCLLLVKDAISKIREMSQFLRPSMLDDFGLGPSLQWLAESFTQRTGIEVEAHIDFDGRVDPAIETHVFRIAQEALTNVGRHSGATRAELTLTRVNDRLRLVISDNGRGFSDTRHGGGVGLIGMRERMSTSGGRFDIVSTKNGLTVKAETPIDGLEQKSANPNFTG